LSRCLAGWRLAVLAAGLALITACASAPSLYVINDTGQQLDAVFATGTRFHIADRPETQTVHAFPEYDWTLKAGNCLYRYPAIKTSDPYWLDYANTARVAGTPDLLMRIAKDFIVRAYTYNARSDAMVSQELRVGGLPMTPVKTCAGDAQQ
jgi:hypothetical protein